MVLLLELARTALEAEGICQTRFQWIQVQVLSIWNLSYCGCQRIDVGQMGKGSFGLSKKGA